MSKAQRIKESFAKKAPVFGMFHSLSSFQTVEVLSWSGFDYLLLDAEHGSVNPSVVHTQLLALGHSKTAGIVRLPAHDLVTIKHYLDLGVDGLMVPNVETAEQAAEIVRNTRYAPRGVRGIAGSIRATRFTRDKSYFGESSDRIVLALQIETPRGMENLDAICDVEGVDVVFFGPNDFAAATGHLGQPSHPEVVAQLAAGFHRAAKRGRVSGILCGEAEVPHYLGLGALMVAVGSEVGLLAQAADGLASRLNKLHAERAASAA